MNLGANGNNRVHTVLQLLFLSAVTQFGLPNVFVVIEGKTLTSPDNMLSHPSRGPRPWTLYCRQVCTQPKDRTPMTVSLSELHCSILPIIPENVGRYGNIRCRK